MSQARIRKIMRGYLNEELSANLTPARRKQLEKALELYQSHSGYASSSTESQSDRSPNPILAPSSNPSGTSMPPSDFSTTPPGLPLILRSGRRRT